jgi:LysM repeat protein
MGWLQEVRLGLGAAAALVVGLACATPQPSAPGSWVAYVVRPGDTLGRIADCRGVSVSELARANGIGDPDRVAAGVKLRVPPRDRCTVRVAQRASDTPPVSAPPPREEPLPLVPASARITSPVEDEACPPPEAALRRARRFLDAGQERFDAADFDGALVRADAAREELTPYAGDAAHDELRAQAHLLAAMSAAGLEQGDRARSELRAARQLDPGLELDASTTSPRILELMQEPPGR